MKPYATLRLTEPQFNLVHGAINALRKEVFAKWRATADDEAHAKEKAFYSEAVDKYDEMLAMCRAVLTADTSQDAEPEEDDEEENEEEDE